MHDVRARRTRFGGPARILIVGAAVVAIAVAAAGLFYLFGRSTPSAVSLADSRSPSPSASGQALATTDADESVDELEGTWVVDRSLGSFADFTSSFVGYRVQEELASVGAATAVGRTPEVSGSLVLEDTTITSVELEADLTTLQSDNSMRDGQLARQGLETATYPTATFVLTEPIELGKSPMEGEPISATATGELTIHGVTKVVSIPVEAELNDGVVTVVGSLDIAFTDYGMTPPESMMVLSVDDVGVMELQLHFSRSQSS